MATIWNAVLKYETRILILRIWYGLPKLSTKRLVISVRSSLQVLNWLFASNPLMNYEFLKPYHLSVKSLRSNNQIMKRLLNLFTSFVMLFVPLNIEYNLRIPDIYLKNRVYDQHIFYLSKSFKRGGYWVRLPKQG